MGGAALLRSALVQFSAVGFGGASLQRIADDAGLSKSSVLYHFGSKEALLDAALRPAVDDLRTLLGAFDPAADTDREAFLAPFVDYLYEHRLAIAVLINHGQALAGHAVVDEADELVRRLSAALCAPGTPERDIVRFGVALAGAAFMLIAADRWAASPLPDEAVRASLVDVLRELVLPRDTVVAL